MEVTTILAVVAACYFIGSIPTAYLAGRLLKGVDIRTIGSGNVGASNAMRLLGKTWGITILLFDAVKGLIPILCILHFALHADKHVERYALIGAFACIIGHVFPIWLNFKGGKGVATGMGVMIALVPTAVTVVLPIFVLVVYLSRYISLGSILAAALLPAAFFIDHDFMSHRELFVFVVVACLFVIYKHKANIKRILAGTENKLGQKKDKAPGASP